MNRLIQHIRTGLPDPNGSEQTDGELLERYVARREEAAFAALVRRHAPMVWGVCRRVVPGHQDAEDAFQATFLVLVRKAASVVPRQMVGNWLYGVAYQTAVKARAIAARRQAREKQVTDMPEPQDRPFHSLPDLQPVLDQELTRLPARYRAVIVLCDLEGKTRGEAARQLGVPGGTVAGWLARARAMLAKRLTRRGVVLSGGSLGAALMQYAGPATVPAAVITSTIQAATVFAAGPAAAGALSAQVATLTEGVLKSMLISKLKLAVTLVLGVAILGLGVTGIALPTTSGQEPKQKEAPPAAGRLVSEPAGGEADWKHLKAEVDRLRADVDALKKQLKAADTVARTSAPAAEPDKAKLTVRVYSVKDLVGTGVDDQSPSVIRIITNIVQPTSWNLQGGPGSVEYFAVGQSLVVSQTADVHEEVLTLLDALRKAKEEAARRDVDRKK
jgi:RNA polymerase sigma factor (sigma-70 family)